MAAGLAGASQGANRPARTKILRSVRPMAARGWRRSQRRVKRRIRWVARRIVASMFTLFVEDTARQRRDKESQQRSVDWVEREI